VSKMLDRHSMPARFACLVVAAWTTCATTLVHAEIELTLKNTFIEKYKNRTSIEDECVVDHSKVRPTRRPRTATCTLPFAARRKLPLVAEIMNAKDHREAIDLSKAAEVDGSKVTIKGAWRIWNEHAGDQTFRQGTAVAKAENTNPDHVFEIHPVTEFGPHDVPASFREIVGYQPKRAEDALNRYENSRSRIASRGVGPRRSSARDLATTTSSSRWNLWKGSSESADFEGPTSGAPSAR